ERRGEASPPASGGRRGACGVQPAPGAAEWAYLGDFPVGQPWSAVSVERLEVLIDSDGASERPVEGVPRARSLEACEPPAGVGTAAWVCRTEHQFAIVRDEPDQLVLRSLLSAADARSNRVVDLSQRAPRFPRLRSRAQPPALGPASLPPVRTPPRPRHRRPGRPPRPSRPAPRAPRERDARGWRRSGGPGAARSGSASPWERLPATRPEKSSPASPPAKAASASAAANSASDWMSTFHPVRRAARRAFRPSLPMASASWSSGTITVASFVSSSTSTSRTRARG